MPTAAKQANTKNVKSNNFWNCRFLSRLLSIRLPSVWAGPAHDSLHMLDIRHIVYDIEGRYIAHFAHDTVVNVHKQICGSWRCRHSCRDEGDLPVKSTETCRQDGQRAVHCNVTVDCTRWGVKVAMTTSCSVKRDAQQSPEIGLQRRLALSN